MMTSPIFRMMLPMMMQQQMKGAQPQGQLKSGMMPMGSGSIPSASAFPDLMEQIRSGNQVSLSPDILKMLGIGGG